MSDSLWYYAIAIGVLLFLSSFFSSSETALTAINRARFFQLVRSGNKRAKIVSQLREEKESLIGAILLGNNAVNTAASALATSFAIGLAGDSEMTLIIVTIIMTFLLVVFAEVLPKTFAIQNPERVSLFVAPLLLPVVKILSPITYMIGLLIRGILKLCGGDGGEASALVSSQDVLRGTIELHHKEGKMFKQERDMLGSILDLHDIEVQDVMIHRTEAETIDADLPVDNIVQHALSSVHSRLPLWREQPDNIIGVLHVKTLMKTVREQGSALTTDHLMAIANEPWFVPETTNLRDQLLAFRAKRQHLALVVDEYGDWQGVITLEDIMEEIVGEIDDEHDLTENDVKKISKGVYEVGGHVTIRDLNRQLDWNLPDDEASTIAGLLIHEAQTIPDIGESFTIKKFRITVIGKADSRITLLKIERQLKNTPATPSP